MIKRQEMLIDLKKARKQERYQSLTSDIEEAGFNCNNIPFEIGSRGHITLPNKTTLTTIHALCNPKTKLKHFIQNISRTTLLCSYSIYLSRNESNWTLRPRYYKLYVTINIIHTCYVQSTIVQYVL